MARKRGWVSFPASHHIHKTGIPRLGGIAVFSTFLFFYLLAAVTGVNESWRDQLPVLLPATLLFIVGLVDDFRNISPQVKLLFQICAASWMYLAHVGLFLDLPDTTGHFHGTPGLLISYLGTVGWVVLITNAFNLIDGLDGLAAGATLFSLIALCGLSLADHNTGVEFATLVLGGSVLGFLRFNFNPASIFLGDCGSLFLGFMLSGLALQPHHAAAPTFVTVAIPLLAFGLPIVETGVSIVRRFLGDKPIFAPDLDHIHHRLLKLGLSQRQAVLVLYATCGACSIVSLFLMYPNRPVVGMILVIVGILGIFGIQSLGYLEFDEVTRLAQRWLEQKKVVANNIALRKTCQQLRVCESWPELLKALDDLLLTDEFDCYALNMTNGLSARRMLSAEAIIDRTLLDDLSEEGFVTRPKPIWTFSMDLYSQEHQALGQLKLSHAYTERNILMDMNLLLTDLQPALCETSDRIQLRDIQRAEDRARANGMLKPISVSIASHAVEQANVIAQNSKRQSNDISFSKSL